MMCGSGGQDNLYGNVTDARQTSGAVLYLVGLESRAAAGSRPPRTATLPGGESQHQHTLPHCCI